MKNQPNITVGIMDRRAEVTGSLNGNFRGDGFGPVSGGFSAKAISGMAVLTNEAHLEIARFPCRGTGHLRRWKVLFLLNAVKKSYKV